MPGFPILHYLLEFSQTHVHWVSDAIQHLILHPFFLSPSMFPSIRVFSSELALPSRWPKYWGFSFSISHSNEYSGLIFFRIDWFELLAAQRDSQESSLTPQFERINSSAVSLLCVQHPYMNNGKTIQTFVGKVLFLLFNMLSRFVIAFLPRSKHLLISWLQSLSAVISEPKKIKSVTVSIVFPSICQEVMGPDVMILVFWMLSFKPAFSLSSFTFIKRFFSSSSLTP